MTLEDFDFREWRMQREKVDFLSAVAQKLCSVDSSSTGPFNDFIFFVHNMSFAMEFIFQVSRRNH